MGGGKGGGEADQSGMYMAMASAKAAQMAYDLGSKQFEWSKQVWEQMQPTIMAAEQQQIDYSKQLGRSLTQMQEESQQQYQEYLDTYLPLEQEYAGEVSNWDSPAAIAQARGEAMGSVAEQGMAGLDTAAKTLQAYGVNPGSKRYASLYTNAQPMLGAAEAAAGTTAADRLRMEKMGLQAGAINTGRGMVNTTGSLSGTGTQAGAAGAGAASGAGQTGFGNVGSTAVGAGATSGLFNAGAANMGVYTGAVSDYNQANADFAKAASGSMGGFGSALGTIGGALIGKFAAGGPVGGIPQTPTDFVGGDERDWMNKARPPSPPPGAEYPGDAKNLTTHVHPLRSMPRRSFGMADGGAVDPTLTPTQGGGATGIPAQPMPPPMTDTSGGGVPVYASASGGKITDDVPAQLNVGEFVTSKEAAQWIGHKALAAQMDKARKEIAQHQARDDVGGEPTMAIPQSPTFVSRPVNMGSTQGAIPGMV